MVLHCLDRRASIAQALERRRRRRFREERARTTWPHVCRQAALMRARSLCLSAWVAAMTAACGGSSGVSTSDDEVRAGPRATTRLVFDFTADRGAQGWKGLFRDVPRTQYDELVRRQTEGLDLGPIPPETERHLSTPDEQSHWFMNAGVYEVADNPGVHGFLLQGVNRSDDMDKYMIREFGAAEGLLPNRRYEVVLDDVAYAGNDGLGAFGPGGGVARTFGVHLVNRDPHAFTVDFNQHVRFTEENRPGFDPGTYDGLGGTGVCVTSGSGFAPPGVPRCPASGRIPFAISTKPAPTKTLSITTNDRGVFWMLIGGHSGHEGLDDYFVIRLRVSISG
jgi:hypothetical protein